MQCQAREERGYSKRSNHVPQPHRALPAAARTAPRGPGESPIRGRSQSGLSGTVLSDPSLRRGVLWSFVSVAALGEEAPEDLDVLVSDVVDGRGREPRGDGAAPGHEDPGLYGLVRVFEAQQVEDFVNDGVAVAAVAGPSADAAIVLVVPPVSHSPLEVGGGPGEDEGRHRRPAHVVPKPCIVVHVEG